ncbi:MAG: GntR family transcriptional regulator [Fusobacteriota bacterium]
MDLKIRRKSNFTIHIQLKDQIKGLILNGDLKSGVQLPTVRQLGTFLNINKNTVSKVYKDLEKEGYVYSVKGRGTFVDDKEMKGDMKEFLKLTEKLLKTGFEDGLTLDEIWGIIYSKGHHFQTIDYKGGLKKEIAFIECNDGSIRDFDKLLKEEIKNIKINGVLISNIENSKETLEDADVIVVPFIHYHEVKKELEKVDNEVLVIGANQSLRILTYGNKFKNKKIGIIGYSNEDEKAIYRQFRNLNISEAVYYGGIDSKGENQIKEFIDNVEGVIICTTVIEKVLKITELEKPHFIFEGKYDKKDLKVLKDLYVD